MPTSNHRAKCRNCRYRFFVQPDEPLHAAGICSSWCHVQLLRKPAIDRSSEPDDDCKGVDVSAFYAAKRAEREQQIAADTPEAEAKRRAELGDPGCQATFAGSSGLREYSTARAAGRVVYRNVG